MKLEELLCAARDGEPGAWRVLHPRLTRELRWLFSRWIPREEQEDVIQEAMEAIVKGLPGLEVRSSLSAWVRGIVRNIASDEISERYEQAELQRKLLHHPRSSVTSPDSRIRRDRLWRVAEAVAAQLPREQRVAVKVEVTGGNDKELAQHEGVSPATIRTRRHRGVRHIHSKVEARAEAREARAKTLRRVKADS